MLEELHKLIQQYNNELLVDYPEEYSKKTIPSEEIVPFDPEFPTEKIKERVKTIITQTTASWKNRKNEVLKQRERYLNALIHLYDYISNLTKDTNQNYLLYSWEKKLGLLLSIIPGICILTSCIPIALLLLSAFFMLVVTPTLPVLISSLLSYSFFLIPIGISCIFLSGLIDINCAVYFYLKDHQNTAYKKKLLIMGLLSIIPSSILMIGFFIPKLLIGGNLLLFRILIYASFFLIATVWETFKKKWRPMVSKRTEQIELLSTIKNIEGYFRSLTESSFKQIYNAAKNLDEEFLFRFTEELGCIDPFNPSDLYITPAAQLAIENNKDAVDLLIKYGATINYIVYATARKGDIEYTKALKKLYNLNPHFICMGLTEFILSRIKQKEEDRVTQAKAYFKELSKKPLTSLYIGEGIGRIENNPDNLRKAITKLGIQHHGYIEADCYDGYIIGKISRNSKESLDIREENAVMAAQGAALAGDFEYMEQLENDFPDIMMYNSGPIVHRLIQCGHLNEVEKIIREPVSEHLRSCLPSIAARYGYFQYAQRLRIRFSSPESLSQIMRSSIKFKRPTYLEVTLSKLTTWPRVSSFELFNEDSLKKITPFIRSDDFCRRLFLYRHALFPSEPNCLDTPFYERARAISHLMYDKGFTYPQALIFTSEENKGLCYFLLLIKKFLEGLKPEVPENPNLPPLPLEILLYITRFCLPQKLNPIISDLSLEDLRTKMITRTLPDLSPAHFGFFFNRTPIPEREKILSEKIVQKINELQEESPERIRLEHCRDYRIIEHSPQTAQPQPAP